MIDRAVGYLGLLHAGFAIANRKAGPFLDLAIRLSLAGKFWSSGIIKIANWPVALELARSEYPVSWMDPVATASLSPADIATCKAPVLCTSS
jgi:hypothetical protein